MNEFLSIAQKTGVWIWRQKEKMVLLLLVGFFAVRVYQVAYGAPPDLPVPKPGGGAQEDMTLPEPREERPRPAEFQSLVQRNPFSIHGLSTGDPTSRDSDEKIDLVLLRIVPWKDSYRAEMQRATETRPKRYEEGEVFGDYELRSIDPSTNTVEVYVRAYDRNFTLKAQQGAP
jgi:hypothetical protein